jgi:hypothetical protein
MHPSSFSSHRFDFCFQREYSLIQMNDFLQDNIMIIRKLFYVRQDFTIVLFNFVDPVLCTSSFHPPTSQFNTQCYISQMLEIGDRSDAFQIYNGVYLLLYMARFVRKEDRGPMEVKVGNESRWICMCGLSSN